MPIVGFTLRQLHYFLGVVESESIAVAARTLGISTSALSEAMDELERQLGASLLIREKGRSTVLSSYGRMLAPHARALLSSATDIQNITASESWELSGHFTFGCTTTLAPTLAPAIISAYKAAHPKVKIDVYEGGQTEVLLALADGRCEAAVCYNDENVPSGFVGEKLFDVDLQVLLPPNHRLATSDGIELEQLADDPFITLLTPPASSWTTALFRAHKIEPQVSYSVRSLMTLFAMVSQGFGYSLLADNPVRKLPTHGYDVLLKPLRHYRLHAHVVVYHSDATPSHRLRELLRICRFGLT